MQGLESESWVDCGSGRIAGVHMWLAHRSARNGSCKDGEICERRMHEVFLSAPSTYYYCINVRGTTASIGHHLPLGI